MQSQIKPHIRGKQNMHHEKPLSFEVLLRHIYNFLSFLIMENVTFSCCFKGMKSEMILLTKF